MISNTLQYLRKASVLLSFSPLLMFSVEAQTIRGILMETGTDRRIQLGELILVTQSGDTIDVTYTNETGGFELLSGDPGDFFVFADALGYEATVAGIFELGVGGEITIEYRMKPFALPIEDLVVEFNRPINQHSLVQNGFVARLNRGVGHFITPHMIEKSPAITTEDLFRNIIGVSVRSAGTGINAFLGDAVRIRQQNGGWCDPLLYIDGVRTENDTDSGMTLGFLVPRDQIEGIEVYRRAAEIPLEYGVGSADFCGVIVLWTKKRKAIS